MKENSQKGLALALLVLVLLAIAPLASARETLFGNVVNTPFATLANGPVGALTYELSRTGQNRNEALYEMAAYMYKAQHSRAVAELVRRGVLPRVPFCDKPMFAVESARPVTPDWTRATRVGGGELTFTFSGWDSSEQTALQNYLNTAYPLMKTYYGDPAFSITVNIIKDPTLQDVRGGTYDASTNEIRIGYSPDLEMAEYYLTIMVLHAFHDDVMFSYEAWETGFARAAAAAIVPQALPSFDVTRDTYYVMQLYDCLDQPDLASPTFWSGATDMPLWRLVTSQAAWLKVYVENPLFFRNFNEAYYAALNADGDYSLCGDVPRLKQIAGGVVSQVEGQPFYVWYQQQYVLDTSIHLGLKLYVYNVPFNDNVFLIYNYHETGADGQDTPRGGRVALDYWNYDFSSSLFANEGYYVDISSTGDDAGVGFISPSFYNIGGPQRITVEARIGGLVRRTIYPYGVRGSDEDTKEIFGAVVGSDSANLTLTYGGTDYSVSVSRGVFSLDLAQSLRPGQLTLTYEPSGEELVFLRNVGFQYYVPLFRANGYSDFSMNLPIDGLALISLPCFPQEEDAAEVLGIDADQLLLASWDPAAPGTYKYKLYPKTGPLEPGKGYWLKYSGTLSRTIRGLAAVSTSKSGYFEVQLKPGWNLIGNPSETTVNYADLKFVTADGSTLGFAEASQAGLIRSVVWGYTSSGYVQVTSLLPWYGYWLKVTASQPLTLLFPVSRGGRFVQAKPSPARTTRGASVDEWTFELCATTPSGKTARCRLGVRPDASAGFDQAFDAETPPAFADLPQLGAVLEEGKGLALLAQDFQRSGQARTRWELQAVPPPSGGELILNWHDLSNLPRDLYPVLVDESTGRRVAMRTQSSYRVETRGETRRFTVEVAPAASGALVATGLVVRPDRGGLAITFSVSRDCQADLEIRNLAGTLVARVASRVVLTRGANTFTWNRTDRAGRPVPCGTYLCQVHLQDETGQRFRTARPFTVIMP